MLEIPIWYWREGLSEGMGDRPEASNLSSCPKGVLKMHLRLDSNSRDKGEKVEKLILN